MKSIIFSLEKNLSFLYKAKLRVKLLKHGTSVHFRKPESVGPSSIPKETLLCTDALSLYKKVKASGAEALIFAHTESDIDGFSEGKYFVLDAKNAEYDYFLKVYKRINNIPWEILRTKRLIIRETVEADVDEFAKIYSDPEITRYTDPLYPDVNEEKRYVTEYREKVYAVQGFGIWTVLLKDGTVIGRAGLTVRSDFEDVETGFVIGTKWQSKGYGTEAVKAVTEYAFKLGFPKVNALVIPENIKSVRLLEKCGYTPKDKILLEKREYMVYSVSDNYDRIHTE